MEEYMKIMAFVGSPRKRSNTDDRVSTEKRRISMNTQVLPIGVCVLPAPPENASRTVSYPHYIHELLGHAGLCYESVDFDRLEGCLLNLQLLVTVGEGIFADSLKDRIHTWVYAGGMWLSIGGVCGVPELFGAEVQPPDYQAGKYGSSTLGEGYLDPREIVHPILRQIEIPLHFFNGLPVRCKGGTRLAGVLDAHQRETPERAGVIENRHGQGTCILIAPDITGSIVRIQQGVGITRDGLSAPDGSSPIADNVLKSDDGMTLDWIFDRQEIEEIDGYRAFLQPVADLWKELVLRSIFYLSEQGSVPLVLLWLYPRNLPAVAHMSHDSDNNVVELAGKLLQALQEAQIHSTWCIIPPGYPSEVIDAIEAAGHDLGMHYDAFTRSDQEGVRSYWGQPFFTEQHRLLTNLFGGERIIANKNHYLRWEGDTEFFEWCRQAGVELDQSKGPSKGGGTGFLFGTCHPYFPVDPQGRILDVLELTTHAQDLVITAPPILSYKMMSAALKRNGILHLLFHPNHIEKEGVKESLLNAVREAKEAGIEWWTARAINRWERSRRKIQWKCAKRVGDSLEIGLTSPDSLSEATLLFLGAGSKPSIEIDGLPCALASVDRFDFSFQSALLDLEPGSRKRIVMKLGTVSV